MYGKQGKTSFISTKSKKNPLLFKVDSKRSSISNGGMGGNPFARPLSFSAGRITEGEYERGDSHGKKDRRLFEPFSGHIVGKSSSGKVSSQSVLEGRRGRLRDLQATGDDEDDDSTTNYNIYDSTSLMVDPEISPYMGGYIFKWINQDLIKKCVLSPISNTCFRITYPEKFTFNVYAYGRRGVLAGANTGALYLRLECPLSSDEATGKAFNGQGLFVFVKNITELSKEFAEWFKPTCLNIWGPKIKKANFNITGIGISSAQIYEKDLVYTFYPHNRFTPTFVYHKGERQTIPANIHALVENSGNSYFRVCPRINMFEFQYLEVKNEVTIRGFLNLQSATMINAGQETSPPAELEERKNNLEKKITEAFDHDILFIPEIPQEIKEPDMEVRSLLENIGSLIPFENQTKSLVLEKLVEKEGKKRKKEEEEEVAGVKVTKKKKKEKEDTSD